MNFARAPLACETSSCEFGFTSRLGGLVVSHVSQVLPLPRSVAIKSKTEKCCREAGSARMPCARAASHVDARSDRASDDRGWPASVVQSVQPRPGGDSRTSVRVTISVAFIRKQVNRASHQDRRTRRTKDTAGRTGTELWLRDALGIICLTFIVRARRAQCAQSQARLGRPARAVEHPSESTLVIRFEMSRRWRYLECSQMTIRHEVLDE